MRTGKPIGRPPVPLGTRRYHHGDGGYVRVKVGHRKWVFEHRLVWEAAHGPLPASAIIHHRNGVKNDNRLDNLELCESLAEHMGHHREANRERMRAMALRPKSPEHMAKIAAALRGKRHTEATKAKLRAIKTGVRMSDDFRRKKREEIKRRIRDPLTGRIVG